MVHLKLWCLFRFSDAKRQGDDRVITVVEILQIGGQNQIGCGSKSDSNNSDPVAGLDWIGLGWVLISYAHPTHHQRTLTKCGCGGWWYLNCCCGGFVGMIPYIYINQCVSCCVISVQSVDTKQAFLFPRKNQLLPSFFVCY